MPEEKKVKQTTVRFYEEDLGEISNLAKKFDVSQAELIHLWRQSYERLQLEEHSTQGENLKTLRAYTDKITNLFTSMTEATQENILIEQNRALEAEKRYEEQVIKTNMIKEKYEEQNKNLLKEINRLEKELDKYIALEKSIEGRLQDKELIIQSKDSNIISLSDELTALRKENKELQEFKEKEIELQNKIIQLKEELKEKDFEKKQALLDQRAELQEKNNQRIQDLINAQTDRQEKLRDTTEQRLREEHRQELAKIQSSHSQELQLLQDELQSIQSKYNALQENVNNDDKKA